MNSKDFCKLVDSGHIFVPFVDATYCFLGLTVSIDLYWTDRTLDQGHRHRGRV